MTESSAVRWDQPRNQSPFKRRGGRRIEINPPNKISKTSIRNATSRSSANPSAHTIVALKPSHWFEKGKTHQRQAQRRAWQTTASTNEHNFCGGAIVLVGEKIIDLCTNLRKRASNNSTTIKSSKILSTSHRAGRTSQATEPKVVRGKSGGEVRGRKVLASAEGAGRQRVPRSGSNDQIKQQQNGRH